MSVAEWDNEYARLARAASQLRSGVVGVGGNDASGLRTSLQRLEANLEQLPLQPTEIQRRRRLIQHLTDSSGGGGVAGMEAGQSHNPHPQQQQQQQQQSLAQTKMQRALQDQDAMIDELATGMGRLKNQTQAIHEEAGMHVNLLNEMETNLDAAQQGLEAETRRAARLKEDQSVWRLQLIVAGLSILLVMLILMGFS
ncbi:hypothetical protein ACA910_015667 [Epithemia clementina (nom. ined.)]